MGLISRLPWWAKLGGKLALSRLPISYDAWRKLGLFRHGEMNQPGRAIRTFEAYYDRAQQYNALERGFISLELGPGDSILSGLVARAYGASQAYLVDAGNFAESTLQGWQQTATLLAQQGHTPPDFDGIDALPALQAHLKVHYLTEGTTSLASIPGSSVNFIWSQVVLEHVPKAEFPAFLRELRRITPENGIGVHSIDFRDHLGGGLNSLRFSEQVWEGNLFSGSGFYTNRIRPREMLSMFVEAGFDVELVRETRWPSMPIKRCDLAKQYRHLPDEDFMVAECEIVTRPKN
ncbi:class I SAM-dependent methyltransferase [Paludibacterium purpuratum]|uniref:Uncharacterized protein n=1 Tax=Paludibacterium purpuratum TaxID=1144873 RepID=A0A4R7B3F9_9NEIS|nr:class I SAM-dependent methyltransferase [Paludibacterium purpuratum]TDR76714.1 hypothetical protein DFP86_110142 [Paludibacterium purpuratum]